MRGPTWKLLLLLTVITAVSGAPRAFASSQSRLMYGSVFDSKTGQPISGATVFVSKCSYSQSATTDSNGSWQMIVPSDLVGTVTFSANGFTTQTFPLDLNADWPYAGGVLSLLPNST